MKILSYHPFSLYANGGGSRILRRLYQGHEDEVSALIIAESAGGPTQGIINEKVVYASPLIQSWARWKLRNLLIWLRKVVFKAQTIKKLLKAASTIKFDVLHVVNHDTFSAALCTDEICLGKKLWVSFHDHYKEIKSAKIDTGLLWNRADRRLVISEELGDKYREEFGDRSYEIITDGVLPDELNNPIIRQHNPFTIYFAGLLHITYLPLFEALANALDLLSARGMSFQLILRGTQNLQFLNNRSFAVEYRPMTLDNQALKSELDAADILYLPIKFTSPEFYLYSLSTKMVGYLAAPGTILYHGPADSAACNLLRQQQAAVYCTTLNVEELAGAISRMVTGDASWSVNAKKLALLRFNLETIRKRFWMQA